MEDEEFNKLVKRELRNSVKKFYIRCKKLNYKILTPEDGHGVMYEGFRYGINQNDIIYSKIVKTRIVPAIGNTVFYLRNYVNEVVSREKLQEAKNSDMWELLPIFKYTPEAPDRFLSKYKIYHYEFYPQVYYLSPNSFANANGYLEKIKLSDVVSSDVAKKFEGLYN